MSENTSQPEIITLRLTMDVTYNLHGENANNLADRLKEMSERAVLEGMLTGTTNAEINDYSMSAVIKQEPVSEDEIAQYMLNRIENGNLALEEIPVRLARYGTMEPNDFFKDMRERINYINECSQQ